MFLALFELMNGSAHYLIHCWALHEYLHNISSIFSSIYILVCRYLPGCPFWVSLPVPGLNSTVSFFLISGSLKRYHTPCSSLCPDNTTPHLVVATFSLLSRTKFKHIAFVIVVIMLQLKILGQVIRRCWYYSPCLPTDFTCLIIDRGSGVCSGYAPHWPSAKPSSTTMYSALFA